jgi:putative membrane protein
MRTALLLATVAIFVALGLRPKTDRLTWFLENLPVILAIPILIATRRSFPLSRLTCGLLFVHGLILMVGGHYSYAHVPLGDWVRDALHLSRNHYDRLGHFAQGFIPAILMREYFLRRSPLRGWQLAIVVIACALAFSALYELFEWGTAVVFGGGAQEFLGSQGDVWDAQWDMFLALCGATIAILTLSRLHDRSLAGITQT